MVLNHSYADAISTVIKDTVKSPTRILIIEDNLDDEVLLMRQVKKAQLEEHVKVIRDGGEALDRLTAGGFKVEELSAIFLDLDLPTMDGLTFLEALRKEDRFQNLPVIVMTSSNSPESVERCRELGVAGYVSKPLTFSAFAKAFADCFHSKRNAQTSRLTVHAE